MFRGEEEGEGETGAKTSHNEPRCQFGVECFSRGSKSKMCSIQWKTWQLCDEAVSEHAVFPQTSCTNSQGLTINDVRNSSQ